MEKWDYMTLVDYHPVDDWPDISFQAYGQSGWELVGVIRVPTPHHVEDLYMAFFKRPWGWRDD